MEEKKEEEEKKFEKGLNQISKIEEKNEKSIESNKVKEQINLNLDNANIEELMNIIEIKNIENDGTIIDYNGEQLIFKGKLEDRKNVCGKGIISYNDGRIYEGVFENCKLNGEGKYISSNGDIYKGIFNNGNISGKGIIIKVNKNKSNKSLNQNDSSEIINDENEINKNKVIYKGDIKDFKKEGNGTEECDEYKYEGNFNNDMKNGEGFLVYAKSGDKYKGEFKDDKITGKGSYIWANGDSYTGDFIEGKMHGKGVYKWPDGNEYIGEYNDNIREGKGVFKWQNGVMFKGNFLKGKPDGIGEMKYKNKIIEVAYKNGSCLGEYKDVMNQLNNN